MDFRFLDNFQTGTDPEYRVRGDASNMSHGMAFHPSLFQTPAVDKDLNTNPDKIRTTNPNTVWDPSDFGQKRTNLYNKGPALTAAQKNRLIAQLNPLAHKSMSNGEATLLFCTFMSPVNMQEIQNRIRAGVFKLSEKKIGNQSVSELLIVMHNVYDSYAQNEKEELISRSELFKHIRGEVDRLDSIVSNLCIPGILDGVEGNKRAAQLILEPVGELPRPISGSTYGAREYRPIEDVLVGDRRDAIMAQTTSMHF